VIVGDDAGDGTAREATPGASAAAGQLQLKDLQAGTQRAIAAKDLVKELERASRTHRHGVGEP